MIQGLCLLFSPPGNALFVQLDVPSHSDLSKNLTPSLLYHLKQTTQLLLPFTFFFFHHTMTQEYDIYLLAHCLSSLKVCETQCALVCSLCC